MRDRIRRAVFASSLTVVVAVMFCLGTPAPARAQGPTCDVDTGDLIAGGETPSRILSPGQYVLWTQVSGKGWVSTAPVQLRGGVRYAVDISQGAGAAFSEMQAGSTQYSPLNPNEVVVNYKNRSMSNRISATVCAVGTATTPGCTVDTTDLIAGGDSPGRILQPGKYVLWTQRYGQTWTSGTPVDLTGGHRYLVDISQGAGAGLQQDPAALNRFSKLGPGEVVVHYHNGSMTDRYSATVCQVGGPVAGVTEPGCMIDTTDLMAGGDSPGRIVQPGKYVLWTQAKGQPWKTGQAVDLAGGHRYLVDISQGASAGLQQDAAALNRFSKLNPDEVVVHYHNGSLTDKYSGTICPAPGSGTVMPTCSVATTDLAPGIETPGVIMAPGSYKLYTRVKGKAWAVGTAQSLTGGHRYLVDISQGAAAGFLQDPAELGKYSRLNANEVVVHYINRSLTDRISGTVCLDGIANPVVTIPSGGNTSVMLLIDTSGSMQGAKLANAISAAVKAIAPLGPSTEIAVISFSGCADSDIRVVSPFLSMTPANKATVTAQIQALSAGGSTALAKALGVAGAFLRNNGRMARRSLVVLTDGQETCGGNPAGVMHDINK